MSTQRRRYRADDAGMFTDLDLDCPVLIAGVPLLLLAQRQGGRLRWALCSDYAAIWRGWAGSA